MRYLPTPPSTGKGADNRILRYALQSMGRSWLWDSAEGLKGPWHRFAGVIGGRPGRGG
jgi:hypothetical protein